MKRACRASLHAPFCRRAAVVATGPTVPQSWACKSIDVTTALNSGDSVAAVRLNSQWNTKLPPLTGAHTFQGGLYRDGTSVATWGAISRPQCTARRSFSSSEESSLSLGDRAPASQLGTRRVPAVRRWADRTRHRTIRSRASLNLVAKSSPSLFSLKLPASARSTEEVRSSGELFLVTA